MALFTLGGLGARPVLADCLGGAPNGVVEAGEQCDDGNLANDDGCTYQCVTPPNCIDDVTGVVNNCTANDVRISLVLNREDVACEMGSMVELDLTAVLVANASERWDIGTFIALDGGNARSGTCRQGYLPPPLAAAGSCAISGGVCNNNLSDKATGCPATGLCSDGVTGCNVDLECPPAPGGTCFVTGEACMADAECPGNGIEINNPCVGACAGGQACIGGYDPTDGFAPFFNGEDLEDPADLCGDLEQGVYTYQEIGFITIPCVDNDGDGKVDIGSCVSWDNNREKTCLGKEDAIPSTKAKCRCEVANLGNVYVAGRIIVQKQTVPAGASEQFGFQSNFGDDFWLADGESWDSGPLPPSDVSGILYWVAESGGADGWQLGNVSCQNELGYPVDAGSIDLLSGETVTCVFTNTRPTCDAGIDIVANCDGIQLDGSAIDPEGDPLSFSWTSDCGASFDDPFQEDPFATLGSSCNASCTFTMTATDGISSCSDSVVVNVDDALPPAFVGPLPGDDTVPCDAVPEAPVLAATDGCGPATVDFQEDASRIGECAGTGILVRTWTASDGCGNSVSHVQNLTIIDAIEPELSGVPDDLVLDCAADLPPADVSASDNCDPDPQVVMEIVSDTRGAECDGAGVVIRRWTATDCSGNSASATQTIVFIDTKAPQLSGVPADLQLECDQALPPANVSASDDCDPDPQVAMEIVSDTRGAVCDGTGVVIRRWTATDCSGNSVSATQTVTFVDTTAPILWGVPLDDTLACDQALPPADVFATDNCDASPRVDLEILSDTRGALCDGAGVVIRRWTATDCSGNSISATQTVTFVDTQAPELAGVPADLQLECDQPLPPADVSASDDCDPDPDIVMEIVSDTRGAVCDGTGVVVRRWTATDCSGNSISATQTVTFVDTQAPELAGVPADLQLECDQPLPPADVSASDNCDPDPDIVMEIVSDTRGAVCDGTGVVVRRWTATDCSGNSVSATQTVTFVDTTAPRLSGVPADAQLECDQPLPSANVTAVDICDPDPDVVMEIVSDTRGAECDGAGVVIRKWTATDCSGNSVSATQTVTFVDTTPPELEAPLFVVLGCFESIEPSGTPFAADNCDGDPLITYVDRLIGADDACPMDYAVERTWTATDCSGNSASVVQGITVDCPCGHVALTKYTNGALNDAGSPGAMPWSFSLSGPGIDGELLDSSPPALVDFGGVELWPDDGSLSHVYTLCEVGIFAGWTLTWRGDANPDAETPGDGVVDTLIPQVFDAADAPPANPPGFGSVFDPNYLPPPAEFVNDTRCVNFVVLSGETEVFSIDNRIPQGEPRTIGYWKNWNTCSSGRQAETAAALGGPAAGVFLLDDVLASPGIVVGLLTLGPGDCATARAILDKRNVRNLKKMASDPIYGLAAQYVAAYANLSVGAASCAQVQEAVAAAQALLVAAGYDGTASRIANRKTDLARTALQLAGILDLYNNGGLCYP